MITQQTVRREAARLVAELSANARESLAEDAASAVSDLYGIAVHVREPRDVPSGCPVDGFYDDGIPAIVIARSVSRGRRNFSILHEFAHRQVMHDDDVSELLWEHPDRDGWRETICDAVAGRLLIPEHTVDQYIGAAGPAAAAVSDLFGSLGGGASREACAVRAAERLMSAGYVVVADLGGTIRFAARALTPRGIARNTRQGDTHPLAAAGRLGASQRPGVTLVHGSGTPTDTMHADCIRRGDYVFGVFTTGRPAWSVPFTRLTPQTREVHDCFCGRCGDRIEADGAYCGGCKVPRCASCGWCSCRETSPDDLVRCAGRCGTSWALRRLESGLCPDCR